MPPVCDLCHEIGHTTKRCKRALKSCSICKSTTHSTDKCTRVKQPEEKRKPSRRHKENATQPQWQVRENGKPIQDSIASSPPTKIQEKGDSSGLTPAEKTPPQNERVKPSEGTEEDRSSDLEHDSSDTYSAESDGYHDDHENFIRVIKNMPWMVIGDFNQTLHPEEHSRSTSLNIDSKTRLFRETLLEADLADLPFKGPTFTWTNKSKTCIIAKKLDRVLVNDNWLSSSPDSIAIFGEPDFSDHAVATVLLKPSSTREKRPFRFYNFLLHNEQFLDYLTDLWYYTNVSGSAMLTIARKLKMIKAGIQTFSKENYSNLEKRVKEAHEKLLAAQQYLLLRPTDANAIAERVEMDRWVTLSKAEERFLFQSSHINSIKGGDCNSGLASWGLNIQTACCFRNNHEETREHLFLSCNYSHAIWSLIFARLDPLRGAFLSWEELLSWIRSPFASAPTTLKKLATQSLLYNVWRQRNSAVHLSGFCPTQMTFSSIDREVRNTISARRHKRSFKSLMQLWIR
ncbi:hypothetical protein Bca52824_053510 [Brassica carinata]|uniref:Reverse transcriptase zinc-binding domain-containing protein n=1 Tax=Brassica carinata TaxID=52824 RepID=A0A8X7R5F8_BRACI|nr:hypothetical protein Bca52824_053510 [Brassica carinata]